MNLLTKTIITILLTLAFATLTFAKTTNFQATENFLESNTKQHADQKCFSRNSVFCDRPEFSLVATAATRPDDSEL